jgi:hypothetical protein
MPITLNDSGILFPDSSIQTTADGNRQFISDTVLNNSASVSLNTSSSFIHYEVVFRNVVPVSQSVTLQAFLVTNNVTQTDNYYYNSLYSLLSNNSGINYGGNYNYIPLTYPGHFVNYAGGGISGSFKIYDCRRNILLKNYELNMHGYMYSSGYNGINIGGGFYNDSTNDGTLTVQGIVIAASAGNLSSGTISLYGWN